MAAIYSHNPFGKQACHYCNFHFSTSLKYRASMLKAMIEEVALRQNELADAPLDSIYFGGGTPSLLPNCSGSNNNNGNNSTGQHSNTPRASRLRRDITSNARDINKEEKIGHFNQYFPVRQPSEWEGDAGGSTYCSCC